MKRKRSVSKRELDLLLKNEGLSNRISEINSEHEITLKNWDYQEDHLLKQISSLQLKIGFIEQEKSNLVEVLNGLGEVLGQNKAEIETLKKLNQNQNYNNTKNNLMCNTVANFKEKK